MDTMQTTTGINAFYRALAIKQSQVMAIEGQLLQMKQNLLSTLRVSQINKDSVNDSISSVDTSNLLDKVQADLMRKLSELLKVKVEDVDVDVELNEYGFDSILFTQFTNLLNEENNLELTPTVFFEHSTIRDFSGYLITEYEAVLASKFLVQKSVKPQVKMLKNERHENVLRKTRRSRFTKTVRLLESYTEQAVSE
ncbi:acyl carrier protein, partial [Bacillus wiedmannii]|uniref:acyl carrier protein n=1 Tax=Bacillus wiedmannii TaxID=1890302 RepID=UPI0015CEF579